MPSETRETLTVDRGHLFICKEIQHWVGEMKNILTKLATKTKQVTVMGRVPRPSPSDSRHTPDVREPRKCTGLMLLWACGGRGVMCSGGVAPRWITLRKRCRWRIRRFVRIDGLIYGGMTRLLCCDKIPRQAFVGRGRTESARMWPRVSQRCRVSHGWSSGVRCVASWVLCRIWFGLR